MSSDFKRALRRFFHRFSHHPYVRDLRTIQWQHRHLYRDRILSGSTGKGIQALMEASRNKHFRDPRMNRCDCRCG